MNEPVKFKKLIELASELNAKLDALNIGKLSRKELEQLTDTGRELYERLVVMRFKAYSDEVKGVEAETEQVAAQKPNIADQPSENKTAVISEESTTFNIRLDSAKEEVSPSQVSLIDAIEEVKANQPVEVSVSSNKMPAHAEPVNEELATTERTLAITTEKPKSKEALHDKLAKSIPARESLAQKLENTPIQDLKKAISINQRFQFARELFKGNNQDYEVSIDKLNTASRDEAMQHLTSLKSKYTWNEESPVTLDFIDLIERRHS